VRRRLSHESRRRQETISRTGARLTRSCSLERVSGGGDGRNELSWLLLRHHQRLSLRQVHGAGGHQHGRGGETVGRTKISGRRFVSFEEDKLIVVFVLVFYQLSWTRHREKNRRRKTEE